MAGYIVLATNIEDEDARVLELYRARWQIEQVFYRLKGLFAFGEVPSRNPDSVRAWFYAKLLLAALCEAMVKDLPFSPKEKISSCGLSQTCSSLLTARSLWRELMVIYLFLRNALLVWKRPFEFHRVADRLAMLCSPSKRARCPAFARLLAA